MAVLPTDTRADVNPYAIGSYIYDLIGEFFVNKYKLAYSESYPKEAVTQPTITWRIYRRVPGGGQHGIAQSRGASYSGTMGTDEFGQLVETHKQQFRITLEFAVFGTSNTEVNSLAWDLENAINDCEGLLQLQFPGLVLVFEQQMGDSNYDWKSQDDLNVRTIRYTIVLPVRYKVILPELREIVVETRVGSYIDVTERLTRTSSNSLYVPIPNKSTFTITDIKSIVKFRSNSSELSNLYAGIDYQVVRMDDNTIQIKWLDDAGTPPQVGEDFVIEYLFAPTVTTFSSRKPVETFPERITESELEDS